MVQRSLPWDLEAVLVGCKGPVAVIREARSSGARTRLSAASLAATGW